MKSSLPFFAALISSIDVVTAVRPARTAATRTSSLPNSIAKIPRGGAGVPFDPDVASKLFIGAFGVNAAACVIIPKPLSKVYGSESLTDSDAWLYGSIGAVGMNTSLLLYLTKIKGMAFDKAIGYSTLPYVITRLSQLVMGKDKSVGMPPKSHVVPTLLNSLVLGFSLAGKPASYLNMFYGAFSLLSAALFWFRPYDAAKAFEFSLDGSPILGSLLAKTFGHFLLGHGVAVCSQARNAMGPGEATGWTAVASGLSVLALIVQGDYGNAELPVLFPYLWAGLLAAIAGSILL